MIKTKYILKTLSLSVLLGCYSSSIFSENIEVTEKENVEVRIEQPITPQTVIPSFAPMLESVLPTVVTINTEVKSTVSPIPEEFRFFFPNYQEQQQERITQGLGSGVIIDAKNGYIVTNNHVIGKAEKITVGLNDGRTFNAKLIGVDPQSDIAVVKIEKPEKLTQVRFANSDALRVGDFSVAIGNPFGLGQTVTSGIISALGRSGLKVSGFENFIQTDASINRGNSGGALINLKGELIGINTAILAPGGGNIGIGFAIPSNMVQDLANQLITFGEVQRGLLGIKGYEMTTELAKAFNIKTTKGAFVAEVITDSSAQKAGIRAGDVIVSIDGKDISSFNELRAKIGTMGAGKNVKLGVFRNDKPMTIDVILQSEQSKIVEAESILPQISGAQLNDGSVDGISGVKIEKIEDNSLAARIGLKAGDLIVGVNQATIQNTTDFKQILAQDPTTIALKIIRGKNQIYLILK